MIKRYALMALQKAINHALSLDEYHKERMSDLNDHTLEMIVKPLDIRFYLLFMNDEIILQDTYHGQIDTTIQSSPMGFIRLSLLPASKVRSLFNDSIEISGNVELGQKVKALFDHLDIDWEGHMAQFTGDTIAYQLGWMVRKGLAFKHKLGLSMQQNITEYLQEEIRAFPPREEVEDFFNDIDELILDVERLSAHIQLLKDEHEVH